MLTKIENYINLKANSLFLNHFFEINTVFSKKQGGI